MRIIDCSTVNFGSYSHLELQFANKGLTIIHGPTGVGKSTIQDAPYWVLFGKSSKGGSVNDRRSWYSNDPTEGSILVELANGQKVTVTRIRGSANHNDLYFHVNDEPLRRGKDITDTQRLINETIGLDADSYVLNGYYTETSLAAGFFTAAAKDRRIVVEKLTNFDFYNKIAKSASESIKSTKVELANIDNDIAIANGILKETSRNLAYLEKGSEEWAKENEDKVKFLEVSIENIEEVSKNKLSVLKLKLENTGKTIDELDTSISLMEAIDVEIKQLEKESVCQHCGSNSLRVQDAIKKLNKRRTIEERKLSELDRLEAEETELKKEISELRSSKGERERYWRLIAETRLQKNPYTKQLEDIKARQKTHVTEVGELTDKARECVGLIKRNETIINATKLIKTNLFSMSLEGLQNKTNSLLETHFEVPIKVTFIATTSDDFDIEIMINGNQSSYYQLSKGQRQLLKLCFGVSVMQVASERSGIDFKTMFFDEALDGMDTDMKVKAYSLFESIAKGDKDIFVIDHNEEFKNMFSNQIEVKARNGISWIEANE